MLQPNQIRQPQVYQGGIWVNAAFAQLEPDDIFRFLNPDGTVWTNEKGESEFVATDYPALASVPRPAGV